MASADEIYLTVNGKGGHAALPGDCIDPVLISASLLQNLQQVVSRKAPPGVPTVLSFGKINSAGGATNVIPDAVHLEGTFRTMDENWRKQAHQWIREICHQTATALGGSCEVDIRVGYPSLFNAPDLTQRVKGYMMDILGEEQVVDLPKRMTAEDFAWYSHHVDACFYRLGTGNTDKGITSPVHTSTFDIDESALETGVAVMAWIALSELKR